MSDQQTVVNVNLTAPAGTGGPVAPQSAKSLGVAILLWWVLGLFGGHRFYLERPHAKTMLILGISGIVLSLVAIGVLALAVVGVWWFIDVFSLSKWIKEGVAAPIPGTDGPKDLQTALLEEAEGRNGRLTVTQAVKATGKPFKEVEETLQGMVSSGYVDVDNDPNSGVVVYVFGEMK